MWKQSLCSTVPISLAIIVAGALFAGASPPTWLPEEGPPAPTMTNLQEVYDVWAATDSARWPGVGAIRWAMA